MPEAGAVLLFGSLKNQPVPAITQIILKVLDIVIGLTASLACALFSVFLFSGFTNSIFLFVRRPLSILLQKLLHFEALLAHLLHLHQQLATQGADISFPKCGMMQTLSLFCINFGTCTQFVFFSSSSPRVSVSSSSSSSSSTSSSGSSASASPSSALCVS